MKDEIIVILLLIFIGVAFTFIYWIVRIDPTTPVIICHTTGTTASMSAENCVRK